eukprot:7806682-Karenia_brevis.AAC.1
MVKDPDAASHDFDIVDIVRKRLQLAETTQWDKMYRLLYDAQAQSILGMQSRFVQQELGDVGGLDWVFAKSGTKVKSGAIPDTEAEDLRGALTELRARIDKAKTFFPKMSVVRRRLFMLNFGAEPGPSGQRN